MLDHEYEVIFKNGISHFQREYFGKKWVLHFRTFMPFWQVLPQGEESEKDHCENCLSPLLTREYDDNYIQKYAGFWGRSHFASVTHYTKI
jgi:hypothetical protein